MAQALVFIFVALLIAMPTYSTPASEVKPGEVVGVGIALVEDKEHNRLVVNACVDGTAAQTAGIQKGDVLLKVDGSPVDAAGFELAVSRIRGAVGTSVALTFDRNGTQRTITLPRVKLSIPIGTGNCESKEKP